MGTLFHAKKSGQAVDIVAGINNGFLNYVGASRFFLSFGRNIEVRKYTKGNWFLVKNLRNATPINNSILGITYDRKNIIILLREATVPASNPSLQFFNWKGILRHSQAYPNNVALEGLCFDGKYLYTFDKSTNPDTIVQMKIDLSQTTVPLGRPQPTVTGNAYHDITFDGQYFWLTFSGVQGDFVIRMSRTGQFDKLNASVANQKGIATNGKTLFFTTA